MVNCDHQEHHQPGDKATGRLIAAFVVIAVFMVVEVVGGWISGSLALLADASHMLTDAVALGLAASANFFAARPADARLHFGYRRAQVLAAFVNGVLLAMLLCWIVVEAIKRFMSPVEVDAGLMLGVAIVGLAANAVAFAILHRSHERNLNVRGAMLHVISDLFGSIAATGWLAIDPLLSIAVAVLIGHSAYRLVRETGYILLEGAPEHIDVVELQAELIAATPQIRDVHGVQISQITPEHPRLTLHARVADARDAASALASAKEFLEKRYKIHDSTIQIEIGSECPDHIAAVAHGPRFEVHEGKSADAAPKYKAQGGAAAMAASD